MPWWISVPAALFAGAVVFILAWCAVVAPGDQRRLNERFARVREARAAEQEREAWAARRKERVHA